MPIFYTRMDQYATRKTAKPLPLEFMEIIEQGGSGNDHEKSTSGNQQLNTESNPESLSLQQIPTAPVDTPETKNEKSNCAEPDPVTSAQPSITTQNFTSSPDADMEVHHHPHLGHKSKPFKEYLLEGFMIFIAVMMGFIAENIRESITDREHVRQLTSQLVQDLEDDTATLNKDYNNETEILRDNDTLIGLLQAPLEKADKQRIQKLIADSHSMWPFHPSAGAIAAIKNELHLKEFANSDIIRYIAKYEGHIDLLHTIENITLKYQRTYLDPFLTQHFTPANVNASFDSTAVPTGEMRNVTQEDLTQLDVDMVLLRINTHNLVIINRLVKDDALKLLHYVTRHYNVRGTQKDTL